MTRSYDMTRRSRQAARTRDSVVRATEVLLSTLPLSGITLDAIAGEAGVTVQTVLRHMGSKEGCFRAVADRIQARVEHQRGRTPPGDPEAAVRDVVAHYEAEGDLVLRLLAQEDRSDVAREGAVRGRDYHRHWVTRCLGPMVPGREPDRSRSLDALVAATDLYTWKLLRRDLGRSEEETRVVVLRLVNAILEHP